MKTLKTCLSAFVLMMAITFSTQAEVFTTNNTGSEVTANTAKKKLIAPDKLPDAIKDAIKDGDYALWKIETAYIVTYSDTKEVEYEVHFQNPAKEQEIETYTPDGEEVDK